MTGWYVMQRGWMDGFKPEPFTEREAFLWSIEQAAYEDHVQWFKGQAIEVARGEFATSLRDMAEAFDWSVKRVRGFMERMGKAGKWAHRQAHDGAQAPTVLSVTNYDKYQRAPVDEGTAPPTAKGTRRAQRGHSEGTQQKEGKQGKEETRPSDSSISEPAEARSDPPPLVAVDEVGPAFAEYQACRASIVPGARPLALTEPRRKHLALRLSEVGGLPGWAEVLARIRGSPFLRGDTSRNGFVAEIDWLLKPENLRKVIEGNYDDKRPRGGGTTRPAAGRPLDAMRAARAAVGLG